MVVAVCPHTRLHHNRLCLLFRAAENIQETTHGHVLQRRKEYAEGRLPRRIDPVQNEHNPIPGQFFSVVSKPDFR